MRVLALTTHFPSPCFPERATYARAQLGALSAKHEVRVVAPISWTDVVRARLAGRGKVPRDRKSWCGAIEVLHPVHYFTPRIFRRRYGFFFRESVRRTVRECIQSFAPDVLFSMWAYPDGWAAVEFGREYKLPVVVKVIGSDIHSVPEGDVRRKPTVECLQGADRIMAVSHDLKNQMVAWGIAGGKIQVIHSGVDAEVFFPGDQRLAREKLGLRSDVVQLLAVGNLVPVKGHRVLIEACRVLAAKNDLRPFECHIIGDGPLRADLQRAINDAGLQRHVFLEGSRQHAEIAEWHRAADLVVHPSFNEGIPNVLLEAAACGAPYVASDVGGIPEVAPLHDCRLVPSGDAMALAMAIQEMLDRPASADRPVFRRSQEEVAGEIESCLQAAIQAFRPRAPAARA